MSSHHDADRSRFPDPVYARTVLAPLFDHSKREFAGELSRINRAHCVMLTETAILTAAEGTAIAGALARIDATLDPAAMVYSGEHEDMFFAIEAELKAILGPDMAGRLHTGRSRNDMDHTILRLRLRDEIDALATKGRQLAQAMLNKAQAERDTIIVAYTHGQPAQPTTFGHYIGAALEVLLRDLDRLAAARQVVDRCPMGAAAITTTGFALDRPRMATLLGFAEPQRNSYGCIATVDYVTASYSALSLMMLHLGRVVQDLQFWTSFEVGQIYVPNGFVQISSIMPQKRNPVPVEHMRLLASQAMGQAQAMVGTMHNTPFTDMNDSEGEVQTAGYRAFALAGRMLDLMAALLPSLAVEGERVRANIDRSCITVTELADTLVRAEGLPFRIAHEIAADVARGVTARQTALSDGHDLFAAAFQHAVGRAPRLSAADYALAVSPRNFIAIRDRIGGPAPAAMDESLAVYRSALQALTDRAEAGARRIADAADLLAGAFAQLTETDPQEAR
ncbi:argininosuccinate lyase [Szabonella alba]|uniref:Argininosuccinate lyase n=1 Tax=Szabonella alba TaxID=2804194 RepID=A0A8K0V7S9_9RHOB|nr:argininosuccinate lyase [Szabonella alba]MBL4916721.1 argininosuccinate lyase [Szabonella alba]